MRYYRAFRSLSAKRIWSQVGPTAIQLTEVESWLRLNEIEDVETKQKYLRFIEGLDHIEMSFLRKRQAEASKAK